MTAPHNVVDSRLYVALQRFSDVVIVSVCWVAASLPVVTLAPATAALLAVARTWVRGEESPVVRSFVAAFRENLRHGLELQVASAVLVYLLVLTHRLATLSGAPWDMVIRTTTLVGFLFVVAVSLWALALMVNVEADRRTVLRWAVLLAVGEPRATVAALVAVGALTALASAFPLVLFLATGLFAVVVQRGFQRVLDTVRIAEAADTWSR